jgi:hypothetical protein
VSDVAAADDADAPADDDDDVDDVVVAAAAADAEGDDERGRGRQAPPSANIKPLPRNARRRSMGEKANDSHYA